MLRIVARYVLAVPGEFDRKTRQRRFMRSRQIADHQSAWIQVSICHEAQDFRVQITGENGLHLYGVRWLTPLSCSNKLPTSHNVNWHRAALLPVDAISGRKTLEDQCSCYRSGNERAVVADDDTNSQ